MSRYNHFADQKYASINFADLGIGEKFRADRFNGKNRRKDIVMVKTAALSYQELKSKKITILMRGDIEVRAYDILIKQ